MSFVAVRVGEAAGVEVGTAGTVLVNRLAVGELRPALVVERWQRAESRVLQNGAEKVVGVRRAARNVDHGPAGHDLVYAAGTRGVRISGGNPAPRRARADGNDRAGLPGDVLHNLESGTTADHAVNPVLLGRDRALDDAHVLACVFVHRLTERGFGLMAGGRTQRFVIVE